MLNQFQRNVRRTQLNNLRSIPNSDPHREKIAWTGDSQLSAEAFIYNFNMPLLYTKWLRDLKYEQDENGYLPCIAPSNGWGYSSDPNLRVSVEPMWTGTYIIIPWYLYLYYGDQRVLEKHYDSMLRWIDCIKPIHRK